MPADADIGAACPRAGRREKTTQPTSHANERAEDELRDAASMYRDE